jgi:hypothetical protein
MQDWLDKGLKSTGMKFRDAWEVFRDAMLPESMAKSNPEALAKLERYLESAFYAGAFSLIGMHQTAQEVLKPKDVPLAIQKANQEVFDFIDRVAPSDKRSL